MDCGCEDVHRFCWRGGGREVTYKGCTPSHFPVRPNKRKEKREGRKEHGKEKGGPLTVGNFPRQN